MLSLGGWHTMGVLRNTTTELGATADGRLVILEPAQWLGRVFPLYPHITWAGRIPRLADGEWTVVLHRAGCSGCRILVPQLQTRALNDASFHLALVELPANPAEFGIGAIGGNLREDPVAIGRLNDAHQRFVQTPTVILLRDGVVRASSGEPFEPGSGPWGDPAAPSSEFSTEGR